MSGTRIDHPGVLRSLDLDGSSISQLRGWLPVTPLRVAKCRNNKRKGGMRRSQRPRRDTSLRSRTIVRFVITGILATPARAMSR